MTISGQIAVAKHLLNLKLMLEGGQCFRWSKRGDSKWIGVVSSILWTITQKDNYIEYSAKSQKKIDREFCSEFLVKYLRLNEDLPSLYDTWSKADKHFAEVASKTPGLRVLDQDPIETLFSFICSSNNNISRISSMVEKMCQLYGDKVANEEGTVFYGFPLLDKLAEDGVENLLRTAGFGYRAKYVYKSALRLLELGGSDWLGSLANKPYLEAKQELTQLEGVGPKVADCICLMALGHLCSVPVDTHVFQIAAQNYLPHLQSMKTCTPKVYMEINSYFQELYGPFAGWAHAVLFCADLKMFKTDPPSKTRLKNEKAIVKKERCSESKIQNEKRKTKEKSPSPTVNSLHKEAVFFDNGENISVKRRKIKKAKGRTRSCRD